MEISCRPQDNGSISHPILKKEDPFAGTKDFLSMIPVFY
jgi:hypothetical protein